MAILHSDQNITVSKSAGGLTYKNVNGRTIVCSKITTNPSNTDKQKNHRRTFALMHNIARDMELILEPGFEKKWGISKGISFIRINHDLMNFIKFRNIDLPGYPPLFYLLEVLSSPLFTGQVLISEGNMNTLCKFHWDDNGIPAGSILLPVPFEPDDRVTFSVCLCIELANTQFNIARNCSHILGKRDVNDLEHPNFLPFDQMSVPELKELVRLPYGSTVIGACMSAMIERKDMQTVARLELVR